MLSRRELMGKAAVGAAAVVVLGTTRIGSAATRMPDAATDGLAGELDAPEATAHDARDLDASAAADVATSTGPAPWALVSPLAAGSVLAHGWQLAALSPVQNGSCVATLRNARGRAQRVHLCRNAGRPQGLVYTRRVDLVVMNEGYGDLPTEERLAQAVARLAHVVAKNEARMADDVFAGLLPHSERVQRFAAAAGAAAEGKLR